MRRNNFSTMEGRDLVVGIFDLLFWSVATLVDLKAINYIAEIVLLSF